MKELKEEMVVLGREMEEERNENVGSLKDEGGRTVIVREIRNWVRGRKREGRTLQDGFLTGDAERESLNAICLRRCDRWRCGWRTGRCEGLSEQRG